MRSPRGFRPCPTLPPRRPACCLTSNPSVKALRSVCLMSVRAFSLLLIAVVLLLALSLQGCAPAPKTTRAGDSRRTLRVLFVGNSYTIYNDLPWVTSQLSLSSGVDRPLEMKSIALMGATLEEHWDDGFALKEIRDDGPWDYVVLQGQSIKPLIDPDELKDYA